VASARDAIQETRAKGEARRSQEHQVSDADASPDDPDADDDLAGPELLQRELGAHIIEEIKHQ
jgi:DNA polymerase-3 subunit gamma/tau